MLTEISKFPDHPQNWITCSFRPSRHSLKISKRSFNNFLSYLADTQTNKLWQNITSLAEVKIYDKKISRTSKLSVPPTTMPLHIHIDLIPALSASFSYRSTCTTQLPDGPDAFIAFYACFPHFFAMTTALCRCKLGCRTDLACVGAKMTFAICIKKCVHYYLNYRSIIWQHDTDKLHYVQRLLRELQQITVQ